MWLLKLDKLGFKDLDKLGLQLTSYVSIPLKLLSLKVPKTFFWFHLIHTFQFLLLDHSKSFDVDDISFFPQKLGFLFIYLTIACHLSTFADSSFLCLSNIDGPQSSELCTLFSSLYVLSWCYHSLPCSHFQCSLELSLKVQYQIYNYLLNIAI